MEVKTLILCRIPGYQVSTGDLKLSEDQHPFSEYMKSGNGITISGKQGLHSSKQNQIKVKLEMKNPCN